MDYVEFGTISILTNLPKDDPLSEEEEAEISKSIVRQFERSLAESEFHNELRVIRHTSHRGCLITVLTIGVSVASLGKFIKDYPKYREGLIALAKDLKWAYVSLVRWGETKKSSCYYRDDLGTENEIAKAISRAETNQNRSA